MKKKILIGIYIVLLILIILIAINLIRNYSILKGIQKANQDFVVNLNNYSFTTKTPFVNNTIVTTQILAKDNIYLETIYFGDELDLMVWFDKNTGETFSINDDGYVSTSDIYTGFTSSYNEVLLDSYSEDNYFSKLMLSHIITPILTEDNHYIINCNGLSVKINKDTKLIDEYILGDGTVVQYNLEKNTVTDDMIEKPDVFDEL